MQMDNHFWWTVAALAVAAIVLSPDVAQASAGGGGGLPYESALTKLQSSATGPVAFTLSLVGIVVAGGTLIFGGDLSGFFRTMVVMVLVIGILISSSRVLASLFGSGATMTVNSGTSLFIPMVASSAAVAALLTAATAAALEGIRRARRWAAAADS